MSVGKEGTALGCSDLISDGEWHVATFDMRKLPNIEQIKGMAFGMESAADEAHLWVDYLRFSATPDGPALADGPHSFPSNITAADSSAFEPRPGWLGNPASDYGVRRDGQVLDFFVVFVAEGAFCEFAIFGWLAFCGPSRFGVSRWARHAV